MNAMTEMVNYRHEKVLFVNNEKAGLKAIIAVHNTNLGPAIGGCRLFPYASYDDALFDVLRLSRGMSHKNAVAQTHISCICFIGTGLFFFTTKTLGKPKMLTAAQESFRGLRAGCLAP